MSAAQDWDIPTWSLADRLRKSLEYRDIEVEDMAQWLEVHPNTIRNWIAGRTRPRPSDLKQWSLRCKVPYHWLLTGEGEELPRVDSNHQPAGLRSDPPGKGEILSYQKTIRDLVPIKRPLREAR